MMLMKQYTIEGCLTTCLLHSIKRHNKKNELELYTKAIQHNLENSPLAHLDVFSKLYKIKSFLFIENLKYVNFVRKIKHSKIIKIKSEKINFKFLKNNFPLITCVDQKIIRNSWLYAHWPHFVIIEKIDKKIHLIDPRKGKIKLDPKKFMKSISYLRNKLWFSPVAIKLDL